LQNTSKMELAQFCVSISQHESSRLIPIKPNAACRWLAEFNACSDCNAPKAGKYTYYSFVDSISDLTLQR
jgi:hypothetical protein